VFETFLSLMKALALSASQLSLVAQL